MAKKSSKATTANKATQSKKPETSTVDQDNQVQALREETDIELQEAANEAKQPENNGMENEETQSTETSSSMAIIIPYKESATAGEELKFTIRAWQKHLPQASFIIIGDTPEWITEDIIIIPHTPTSDNPQIDVANKMLVACDSDLVPEYFIWSNDDIFPLCPLTMTDLDLLVAHGKLGKRGSSGSVYHKNASNTLLALKKAGVVTPFDYATHTPVVFWKKELQEIIQQFNATETGHLISSLYFNLVYPEARPILVDVGVTHNHPGTQSYVASVFRSNVDQKILQEALSTRKFINCNDAGWTAIAPALQKLFPEKSAFEK